SALTTFRQELAASISAFTQCAITERIYVSYSFDVLTGAWSINDLIASRCASAYSSCTSVSVCRSTTIGPVIRCGGGSGGVGAVRRSSSAAASGATPSREEGPGGSPSPFSTF